MKALKICSFIAMMCCLTTSSFAQVSKKETFKVDGACGMCKKKIEKAARDAGASYALWNTDSKILTVKYKSTSTNTARIQQKIAGVGYDTPKYRATDEAYNSLHECCQYERSTDKSDCCGDAACKDKKCCKDGKCTKESADCCKQ